MMSKTHSNEHKIIVSQPQPQNESNLEALTEMIQSS